MSADGSVLTIGQVSRALPQPTTTDNIESGPSRVSRYREDYVLSPIPTKHILADEGSYLVATNPTPGTALAYTVQAAFSDTVPFLYLFNAWPLGDGMAKRLFIDYIKVIVTTAAASGVQAQYAVVLDNVNRALSTDNTTSLTPVCPNMDASNPANLVIKAQNNATASAIAASSSNKRIAARGSFGGVTVVGDELVMLFGAPDPGAYSGLTAAQATCPGRKVSNSAPLAIGPQQSACVHLWFPSNATTGLSYELEVGAFAR